MPFFISPRAYLRPRHRQDVTRGKRTIAFGPKERGTLWMLRWKPAYRRCCIRESYSFIPTADRHGSTNRLRRIQRGSCSHRSRLKLKSNASRKKEGVESFCGWVVFTVPRPEAQRTCSVWRDITLQRSSAAR